MKVLEVLLTFLRLGWVSFGGPVAHLGYFRTEFVERRNWIDEITFGELIGLYQFLTGPASSQFGFSIGLFRAGLLGGLAVWTCFTTLSALLMLAFARGLNWLKRPVGSSIVGMLELVANWLVIREANGSDRGGQNQIAGLYRYRRCCACDVLWAATNRRLSNSVQIIIRFRWGTGSAPCRRTISAIVLGRIHVPNWPMRLEFAGNPLAILLSHANHQSR